jgi:iron complex outermembrane receptor protein
MSRRYLFAVLLIAVMVPALALAQGTITGTVTDATTGDALPGANVIVAGQPYGGASDLSGAYVIEGVPAGNYEVSASVIGYETVSMSAQVASGVATTLNFALSSETLEMSALEVLASRAGKNTPVAYTNVDKEEMEVRLGSQDIPLVLNTTPSVYATNQGGGAGDARINVRGFNQRNVAVMINGVPQNDMENGWVYWSNWDGVGDATSSIQMQRGLSAVNLATPSIGGTMNIITDPTALEAGGSIKQEMGSGAFMKTTANYNTGLIAEKMAFSATVVRKTGEGIVDGNWTDAWAYYFGASYALNADNRFELYAIGAPQRHGQNLYKQNLMAYDKEFAAEVADKDALMALDSDNDGTSDWDEYTDKFVEVGHNFNQNVADISSSYTGQQYWYMYGERTVDRFDPNFLNERENYFHKPLVNLNHYLNLSEKMRLSTVAYWSGGSGGGTGTYGKIPTLDADGNLGDDDYKFYYGRGPWTRDWDALVAMNSGSDDTVYVDKTPLVRTHGAGNNQSVGILRNSINRQNTIGVISKLNYDMSSMLKLQFGIDWRTAGIEHTREVRDLMGGDYYLDDSDPNVNNGNPYKVMLGDNIDYYNKTTVDWIGTFAQASYEAGALNAYGMAGFSSIKYSYQDLFTTAQEVIKSDAIGAMQIKGGGMFHLADNFNVFGNFGYVEKPPIMDNVIYYDGTVAADPSNEKFTSTELGLNFNAEMFAVSANVYNTDWIDRNLTKAVTSGQGSSGDTDVIFLTGVNQNHKGVEIEASVQPMRMLRLDASLSFGNWQFVDDADGDYQNEAGEILGEYRYALKDLKVGDMPQTAYVLGATLTPMKGLRVQALYSIYDNNYSDWSPDSRIIEDADDNGELSEAELATADREQVWAAPGYSKMDLHVTYDLPKIAGINAQLFAHVFNALDATYVQDAVDNSQYNGWSNGNNSHSAERAEVFLGTERFMNFGLKLNF